MLMTVVLSGFAKLTINEFSSCIFYLLIFTSKFMNMCLMITQICRWSDRHAAPRMVLVPQVVVTHCRDHP
jgi:hypothetical protein